MTDDNPPPSPTTESTVSPRSVVGIGASAGGLEALQTLFSFLPADTGAAFVVIQHLSPDFKSLMDQLLGRCTAMPVHIAQNGEAVQANSVYLIPATKTLTIQNRHLHLAELPHQERINLPIDRFFRSLAEDLRDQAIGILLSGTGSDGTQGIRALKETGGLIIVQDPTDAKFDGMPNSALRTGLVDLVLPARQIPDQLIRFLGHQELHQAGTQTGLEINTNDTLLQQIFQILQDVGGIDFSQYKPSTVARRIERRMGVNQLQHLADYLKLLQRNRREASLLSRELLIGVTRFFRDSEAFDYLGEHILPALLRNTEVNTPFRIWCAGCATGEEAYSLGILVMEVMERLQLHRTVKIFATDVDSNAIATASAGLYPESIVADVNSERLERFFIRKHNQYQVINSLRQMVVFAAHNLISDPPFSRINLASCRNLLIYFQHGVQQRALSCLHFSLIMEGVLLLGSSESLGELGDSFLTLDQRHKVYRKYQERTLTLPSDLSRSEIPQSPTRLGRRNPPELRTDLGNVGQRLLENYLPPCILLNKSLEAIHTLGDVSPYIKKLKPGRVSVAINDLIHDDLSIPVMTGIRRALQSNSTVLYRDIDIQFEDAQHIIDLRVLFLSDHQESCLAVVFETDRPQKEEVQTLEHSESNNQLQQRISDLEQELKLNQENLQTTLEELETTNEELQSTNEELMAANEELQSTNEELQSVNEELYTVNAEFHQKIIELTQANDDLDNLLDATGVATVFLDERLLLRRYTPSTSRYLHILPQDIGRPIQHIAHQLQLDDLEQLIQTTLIAHQRRQKRLKLRQSEHEIFLRILPYESTEGNRQGVILTFIDPQEMISEYDEPVQATGEPKP